MTAETCWCAYPTRDFVTFERCGSPATDDDGLCDACRSGCRFQPENETETEPETSVK